MYAYAWFLVSRSELIWQAWPATHLNVWLLKTKCQVNEMVEDLSFDKSLIKSDSISQTYIDI